jgi:hypothetical protein
MLISKEEGKNLILNFLNDNVNNQFILKKNDILEKSNEPRNKFFTLFGLTEDHIQVVNPFLNLRRIILDQKEDITFGFNSGLFFLTNTFYFTKFELGINITSNQVGPISIEEFRNVTFGKFTRKKGEYYKLYLKGYKEIQQRNYSKSEIDLIDLFKNVINEFIYEKEKLIEKELIFLENQRINKLNSEKSNIIKDLDKDSNGEVDLIDGETFNKLLTKNQKIIIEIDKNYIQKFVKISMYLKTKKSNTQKIFDSIKDTKNDTELNELVNLLKNQIHTYELLVFHSISMITSLIDSDLISFYEIYECFDQLGVFNSNWENDVSGKLSNIGEGIKDLMYSIYHMEQSIVNSLDNLSYVTQDSFQDLRNSMDSQLSSIDSSIQCNNLLTGIQTYQMYRINQNTNRIN